MSVSPLRALLFLMVAMSANFASGFVSVHHQPTSVTGVVRASVGAMTPLNVANPNMEAELLSAEQQLRIIELPKNARPKNNKSDAVMEPLLGIEVNIGRVAMLAALYFCVVELTTGMSLPEQLATISSLS